MLLKAMIDEYYKARGLVQPNAEQALLGLIRELGELAGAYRVCCAEEEMQIGVQRVLHAAVDLGLAAEEMIQGDQVWVRNNNRWWDPNVGDRIGDVLMMLDRFSQANRNGDVVDCLVKEMEKKLAKGHEEEQR